MADQDFHAVKIGPVIVGRTTERRPRTQADHRRNLLIWGITVFFIGTASPVTAFVLVILTAIYLAAHTAPQDDERTTRP